MMAIRSSRALVLAVPLVLVMCSGSPSGVSGDAGVPHPRSGSGGGTGSTSDATAGGDDVISPIGSIEAGGEDALGTIETPAACPAAAASDMPLGKDAPDATGAAVNAITYTNVGRHRELRQGRHVDGRARPASRTCMQDVPKDVSGPLVPFDEEMTMVFSGPMDLYQVAAYEPGPGGYRRVAYWDPCTTEALAFVGNKSWYQCNGYVRQSYVTDDGSATSPTPVQFAGHLDPGVGVNARDVDALHRDDRRVRDCGFSRGLCAARLQGRRAAGSKIFVTKFRMPLG